MIIEECTSLAFLSSVDVIPFDLAQIDHNKCLYCVCIDTTLLKQKNCSKICPTLHLKLLKFNKISQYFVKILPFTYS